MTPSPRLARAAAVVLLGICSSLRAQGDESAQDTNELRRTAFAAERGGDHNVAAEAFLKLCELEADNPDWFVKAADNLGKVGRFNDAMALLEKQRERFPDVPVIDVTLARLFHLKADTMAADGIRDANVLFYYEDTARAAERVLARDPEHLEARLLLASSKYQLGELESALENAERAVADHPDAYGGHAMVGRIRFHRFVQAKQRLAQERPTGREMADLIEEIDSNRDRAVESFTAAAEADQARSFPIVKLGDIAAWTGRTALALGHYRHAMSIDASAAVDHAWLRANTKVGQRIELYQSAFREYEAREDATPKGAAILTWYLAQAYFDKEDWKRAYNLFSSTLELLPDYRDTYYYAFRAAYWSGADEDATRVALAFARLDPRRFADLARADEQTLAVVRGTAASLFAAEKLAESRDLNQVLAYAMQTADEWNNYAFLCRETGQFEQSLQAYREALSLEPESPQLLNDAAVILQFHLPNEENLKLARELYERAIANARKQLAKGGLAKDVLERTEQALLDAKSNLALLDK